MQEIIKVTELSDGNIVDILRPQKGSYVDEIQFRTEWSEQSLRALAELKGEWFYDSYQRFEHPNYVQKQIDFILEYYELSLGDKRILDFGCGFGASTYCMLKRGADNITVTELDRSNLNFCSNFLEQMGFADNIDVHHEDMIPTLKENTFDVIWLQAVAEHLLPEERYEYMQTFWKALDSKGLLIITEVPNRHWPIEVHTTGGTWFLSWRKPNEIFRLSRKKDEFKGYSDTDFYRSGIVGVSYADILNYLDHPLDNIEASLHRRGYLKKLYSFAEKKSRLKSMAVNLASPLEPALHKLIRRPFTAFMPFLNHLVFQKE